MATEAQINAIVGLYVAYFDRAPDPVGLQFWIDQLDNGRDFTTISQDFANSSEAQAIYPYLSDNNDLGTISPVAFITNIYANLFGRVPDQEGLEFWTEVLESGAVAPGDMVEAISLGAYDDPDNTGFFDRTVLDNKIECARYFTEQASQIPTFPMGEAGEWLPGSPEYLAAVGAIGAAGDNDASIDQCKEYIDNVLRDFIPNSTFTLCEVKVFVPNEATIEEIAVTEKVLYWGFANTSGDESGANNPPNPGETPGSDSTSVVSNGIPADAFFGPGGYLETIALQEFAELDVIDTDMDQFSIIDWSSVTDIQLTVNTGPSGTDGDNDLVDGDFINGDNDGSISYGGTLTVTYPDGSTDDIALGEAYFDFLCKLILDDDGNSRFYEQEVVVGLPVYIDASGEFTTVPQPGQEPAGTIPRGIMIETPGEGGTYVSGGAIVLTPTENNGGTKESGFTSDDNDFIQVGQLDLLHGAIIDGGGGSNTLEIDAKGVFAQPKSLANIQEIAIENLPNIYTVEAFEVTKTTTVQTIITDTSTDPVSVTFSNTEVTTDTEISAGDVSTGVVSNSESVNVVGDIETKIITTVAVTGSVGLGEPANDYPDVQESGAYFNNSVIDITRATDLESLTVTQGDFEDLLGEEVPGDLTVTGIRNGATVTLDGFFGFYATGEDNGSSIAGDVRLNFSGNSGDGVDLVFNNLNMQSDLEVSHNATKLNIESTGGGNYVRDGNFGNDESSNQFNIGSLQQMIITGDAYLHIENDLNPTFSNTAPVLIDASANTGGVRLQLSGSEDITFKGSSSDDLVRLAAFENTGSVPSVLDDSVIVIEGGEGDDRFEAIAYTLTATAGDGNNNFETAAVTTHITAGKGNNDFQVLGSYGSITAGDGDNTVDLAMADAFNSIWPNRDDVPSDFDVTLGNGANTITFGTAGLASNTASSFGSSIFGNLNVGFNTEAFDLADDIDSSVNINVGDGGNEIVGTAATINITSGDGDDNISVSGQSVSIDTNGGNDEITLVGFDDDYVTQVSSEASGVGQSAGTSEIRITAESGFEIDYTSPGGTVDSGDDLVFRIEFTKDGVNTDVEVAVPVTPVTGGSTGPVTAWNIPSSTDVANALISALSTIPGIEAQLAPTGRVQVTSNDGSVVSYVDANEPVPGYITAVDEFLTDNDDEFATVFYSVGGTLFSTQVTFGSTVDVTDASQVASAIANALDDIDPENLVNAESDGDSLVVSSNGAPDVRVVQIELNGGAASNSLAAELQNFFPNDGGYGAPGVDSAFNYKGFVPSVYGMDIDIDTGSGSATINLGRYTSDDSNNSGNADNSGPGNGAIVAKEGSVITGSDITLFVNTHADLRAADLNGITSIVFDDDNRSYTGQGFSEGSTSADMAASLTLMDSQVAALGEDVFTVQGQTFGAQAVLTIVITDDTVLSDLIDLQAWNDNVKLCFVVSNDATLTLTAEELHKYVAPEGIAVDEENGYSDNQVVVTNAGFDFDPFNDQYGGTGAGTIAGSLDNQDYTIIYVEDGYERPQQDPSTATITIDSDVTSVVNGIESRFANTVEIEGDADLVINGRVDLANDFTIDFSELNGDFPENADGVEVAMTIYNFQELTGDVNSFLSGANDGGSTNTDPYGWGEIIGNGTSDDPVRIDIVMQPGTAVGDCDWGVAKGGFTSTGVQQYVLTGFVDTNGYDVPQASSSTATIVVCDMTEDLEVIGLQNNRNATVTYEQVNWSTDILMEGDGYANASDQEKNLGDPDKSEVGEVIARFFESGANAAVRLTNQGVALGLNEDAEDGFDQDGERYLEAKGITVINADRLSIKVEDGDARVEDVTGPDVERLLVSGPKDVELVIRGVGERSDTGVSAKPLIPENLEGGFDSDDLVQIDGSNVTGVFKLTFTADTDLSDVSLAGIDAICLDNSVDPITLTMTADQLVQYGDIIETTNGTTSTLNVEDMGEQSLDLTTIDVDNIGTVTFDEGDITVDASTDFGGADALVIPEDSNVTMTVAQFNTADGADDGEPTVLDSNDTQSATEASMTADAIAMMPNDDNNSLTLTEVPNGEPEGFANNTIEVNLTDVSTHVDVNIVLDNLVATSNFDITGGGGETVTLVISGTTDLSAADISAADAIMLKDGSELTLSEEQLADIQAAAAAMSPSMKLSDMISVEDGGTAKLNINDIDGLFNLPSSGTITSSNFAIFDLQELSENVGGALEIGDLVLSDFGDTPPTFGGSAIGEPTDLLTSGTPNDGFNQWNLGGAERIVTPTADLNDAVNGLEPTTLFINQTQFFQLKDGTIVGDGKVNLVEVTNNNDTDADFELDNLIIDTSNITAPKNEIWLLEEGATVTATGETVTLEETSDVSGFTVRLTDGQLFRLATEAQASGAQFREQVSDSANPTGVVWLFDTWSGTPIDTSGYPGALNTLFVDEDLVNDQNEEAIWTTLPSTIVVQKFNDAAPKALVVQVRINTFEPFGSALDGITFDDQGEYQTTGGLILNLEGNVQIGNITIDDTVGDGAFQFIEINSTLDIEHPILAGLDLNGDFQITPDEGILIQPNIVGDILLQAPVADGTSVNVVLNTSDGQADAAYANGTDGDGTGSDTDAGLPLVTGTIFLGMPGAGANMAFVDIVGNHSISVGGIDYSDPALTMVNVDTNNFTFGANDFTIGSINIGDLSVTMDITGTAGGDLDRFIILDDFTADSSTDFDDGFIVPTGGTAPGTDAQIILGVDGNVDLSQMGSSDTVFDVDGILALSPGTLTLTADQIFQIGTPDTPMDGAADNWVLGPGVNPGDVTLNVTNLTSQLIDLDEIAAAGFNIGTITIEEPGADLDSGTTLGNADQIVLNIVDGDVTLEMTAEQYNGLADGTIIENRGPLAEAEDVGTVLIDNVFAIEDATTGEATIDVSNVNTTGANQFFIEDAFNTSAANFLPGTPPSTGPDTVLPTVTDEGDTTFSAASNLGTFGVTLVDRDTPTTISNELAGQTVRFSTEVQADGRMITILGADDNATNNPTAPTESQKDEKDTNVVWLFDSIAAPDGLDVSGYDGLLGRIWVSDELVDSVGGDVDSLFTVLVDGSPEFTLDPDIIKRIETLDLTPLLDLNQGIDQTVEVTAFTTVSGAEFEIDDPLISLQNLDIFFGGATDIEDLELDNLLGPVNPSNPNFPGDDDFLTLTLNSFLANNPDHFLLPDAWTDDFPLPSDFPQVLDASNNIGDISSGSDRGVLRDIVVNLGTGEASVTTPGDGAPGTSFTVTLTVDADPTDAAPAAALSAISVGPVDASNVAATLAAIEAAINAANVGVTAVVQGGQLTIEGDGSAIVTDVVIAQTVGDIGSLAGTAGAGEQGADLNVETIFFSDDGDTSGVGGTTGDPDATIDIQGTNDMTAKSFDTTDADIVTLTVDTTDHLGTLTITGGSPAFDLGDVDDNTTTLTLQNSNQANGVITAASSFIEDDPSTAEDEFDVVYTQGAGQPAPWSGVSGEALTDINTFNHGGTISLGVLSEVDGDDFTLNNSAADLAVDGTGSVTSDSDSNTGVVYVCLGDGLDDGTTETPTLNDGGQWTFAGTPGGGDNTLNVEIKNVDLGAGTLTFEDTDVTISGDVDFSGLDDLIVDGSTIEVEAGATLRLTVEQVTQLQTDSVDIVGAGKVEVVGTSNDDDPLANTDFRPLRTATVDLSLVELSDDDNSDRVEIRIEGAIGTDGMRLLDENGDRIPQTIIGTAENDEAIIAAIANDSDNTNIDVVLRLGDDDGDIGDPIDTPTDDVVGPPAENVDPLEVQGDVIRLNAANPETGIQIEVDLGFDSVIQSDGIDSNDVVKVSANGEFYSPVDTSFVATDETSNDGIAVLEITGEDGSIDVSAATGTVGFNLLANREDDNVNVIVGTARGDYIDGGDTASGQVNQDDSDLLEGGAGSDTFNFGVNLTTPDDPEVDDDVVSPVDNELLTVTAESGGSDGNNESVQVALLVNGTLEVITTDLSAVNTEDADEVAAAIAIEISAEGGLDATAIGGGSGEILVEGLDGTSVEFSTFAGTNLDGTFDISASEPAAPNDDEAQEALVTIPSTVMPGEEYSVTITMANGTEVGGEFIAPDPATANNVRDGILTALVASNSANGNPLDLSNGGADPDEIIVLAAVADNGGFSIVASAKPAVDSIGSSGFGAADLRTADIITDFMTGEDTIQLNATAGAGIDGTNYEERDPGDAEATSYADALAEAQSVIDGTVAYYFTTSSGTTTGYDANSAGGEFLGGVGGNIPDQGLLFYDADGNGSVDGVVHLVGVDLDDIQASDIA